MEQNNQSMMIESANPSMLWANIASYLGNLSKSMNKTYVQRRRKGGEITWAELDEVNKNLHHQLDIIISGDRNVTDNTAPKYESVRRSNMKLTESDIHRIIKESVKRVLNEALTPEQKYKRKLFKQKMEEKRRNALIKDIYERLKNQRDYTIVVDNNPITDVKKDNSGRIWIEIAGDYHVLDEFSTKFIDKIHSQAINVSNGY